MRITLLALLLIALGACGGEPFESHPPDDIKPGGGVFTGDDGELVIYRR